MNKSVWIIIVNWNSRDDLQECLLSIQCQTFKPEKVVVIDNASNDGSLEMLKSIKLPNLLIKPQNKNLGFAKANNVALRLALEAKIDYVVLLNPDTIVAEDWLEKLVDTAETDQKIAICQSVILLYDHPNRINSDGNIAHFLGFGYCGNYGKEFQKVVIRDVCDIGFASGASMLIRADVLKHIGLLSESLGLYGEDLELSLRARMAGYRIVISKKSLVWHKYKFSSRLGNPKFYFLERNRWIILLSYYRFYTLLCLLPILILIELGVLFYAWKNKWAKEKIISYLDIIRMLGKIKNLRTKVQQLRRISDREFLVSMTGYIKFSELRSFILENIGNPIMEKFYLLVMKII